jgi:hypothetical protein
MSNDFADERRIIVEPLSDMFEAITKNAVDKAQEYTDWINESQMEVVDDETGMTNHDLWDSQCQDISFEYELQIRAISTSLIIVAQAYLHSKFQHVISAHRFFKVSFNEKDLQNHYFSLGPKASGVPWAEAVKAASNYVRHYEEWNVKTAKFASLSNAPIVGQISSLILQLRAKFQATPRTLVALGFTEEDVLDKQKNLTSKFVRVLNLHEPASFAANATDWIEAVMDDLHQKFDHLDK